MLTEGGPSSLLPPRCSPSSSLGSPPAAGGQVLRVSEPQWSRPAADRWHRGPPPAEGSQDRDAKARLRGHSQGTGSRCASTWAALGASPGPTSSAPSPEPGARQLQCTPCHRTAPTFRRARTPCPSMRTLPPTAPSAWLLFWKHPARLLLEERPKRHSDSSMESYFNRYFAPHASSPHFKDLPPAGPWTLDHKPPLPSPSLPSLPSLPH